MLISKRTILAVSGTALAAAAVSLLVFYRTDWIPEAPLLRPSSVDDSLAAESEALATYTSQRASDIARGETEGSIQQRKLQPEHAFSGMVVEETGTPVQSVWVSWTPLPEVPITDSDQLAAHVSSSSIATVTDETGKFHFDTSPPSLGERSSVVWLTHPEFEALAIPVSPNPRQRIKGVTYKLTRTKSILVKVLDADRAVDGAVVLQRSLDASKESAVLAREVTTDAQGVANVHPMPGRLRVLAQKGGKSSAPWEGFPTTSITLSLGSMFAVEGVITRSGDIRESTSLAVVCTALVGGSILELARLEHLSDRWGPIELAVLPVADEYSFRLEGTDIIPKEARLAHVLPGHVHRIDFEAEVGNLVWFLVVDEEENHLPNATAAVRWKQNERYVGTSARAREDGYIAVGGCPPGVIEASFACVGYAPSKADPFVVPEPDPITRLIVLPRAATVTGKCTWRGEPVPNFELVVWPTESITLAETYRFTGRGDGSFELDTVPLGRVSMVAASSGRGMSDAIQIVVPPEGVDGLAIGLPDTIRAWGRVVDSRTGDSVSTAHVQLIVGASDVPIEPSGSGRFVEPDGSFEIAGLPRGLALLLVTAPDFSSRQMVVTTEEGLDLDLGLVRLFPKQSLVVRLQGSAELDPSNCVLSSSDARGRSLLPIRSFDSKGETRFDSVSSGRYGFDVDLPDGSRHRTDVELVPGKKWIVDIDLSFGGSLSVEVIPRRGEALPPELGFIADHKRPNGIDYRNVALDSSGKATIRYLPPGVFQVGVHEPGYLGGERLASRRIELGPSEARSLRIEIGAGDRWLRVVDPEGNPLPGVSVDVNLPGSRLFHESGLKTDDTGRCWVQGLTEDRAIFHLMHPLKGVRAGIYVDLPREDEDIVLVLDGNADTELSFVGRRGPIAGIVAILGDLDRLITIDMPPTNENGSTIARNLTEGEYHLRVAEPDYLPIATRIQVVRNGGPQVFGMRKRCRIEIQAREGGPPRANLPIDLRHLDSNTTVRDYLERYKLFTSSTGSTTTGSDGRLILEGAPEGDYRWVIESEGQELSGTFTAEPGSNTFYVDVL